MSRDNVEIVREIYRRWGAGESTRELIASDLEYVNPPYAVESGTPRDRRTLQKIREVFPDFRVEPERFVDAGAEVAVIGTAYGTTASGAITQWRQGYVWTIEHGRAVRFRWFNEPKEALKAVGLED